MTFQYMSKPIQYQYRMQDVAVVIIVKQHLDVGRVLLVDAVIHLKMKLNVVGLVYLMAGLLLEMIQQG